MIAKVYGSQKQVSLHEKHEAGKHEPVSLTQMMVCPVQATPDAKAAATA